MARTALTPNVLKALGTGAVYVTPDAAGVSFRNNGKCFLHVINGSGASINVTPKIGRQVLGQSVTSVADALPAGESDYYGPYSDEYEQPGGLDTIFVDFSSITTVTVALLTLP
jgi:hypothetical protein